MALKQRILAIQDEKDGNDETLQVVHKSIIEVAATWVQLLKHIQDKKLGSAGFELTAVDVNGASNEVAATIELLVIELVRSSMNSTGVALSSFSFARPFQGP